MENVFLTDQEIINIFKDHLKIESRIISILDLFNARYKNKINYSPYYQRKYVWDDTKATYFIESIFIGTEIPPLILFHGEDKIEIIDGRQRYETIKNFYENKLVLNLKGLMMLKKLNGLSYDKLDDKLLNRFLDYKIRVIDFRILNEPKLDPNKEDLIKKEIFRRYNSGITPLKRSDVDKAVFIEDPITKELKEKFTKDKEFYEQNLRLFFPKKDSYENKGLIEDLLSKIRLSIALPLIPIKYYSTLENRRDIINLLYHKYSEEQENINLFLLDYEKKISCIQLIKEKVLEEFNQLMSECLFWVFRILENEGFSVNDILSQDFIEEISKKIIANPEIYTLKNSLFYREFNQRYRFTLDIFEKKIGKELKSYLDSYDAKEVRENINIERDSFNEGMLDSQYITKPEPSAVTILALSDKMKKSNFRVRPIYQRNEVMNIDKASSLIESILLDIKLPPIFVFKNKSSVLEVVDGQQRILAILGFIGETYRDETGTSVRTNKNEFRLKNLSVYRELDGKKFNELDEKYKDRILDFNLSIVEIDSSINEKFNPIDLFIRLNSKPYPIKENTFEMWNSYAHIDIIKKIKENMGKISNWFYITKPASDKRMQNEELYTTLVYLENRLTYGKENLGKILDVYKMRNKIVCRISDKKTISKLLVSSTLNDEEKEKFIDSIKVVEAFISKLKTLLIAVDIDKDKLEEELQNRLDKLFSLRARRRLQNFYLLYPMLNEINLDMIREKRKEIFNDIQGIYNSLVDVSEGEDEEKYFELLDILREKYCKDKRKICLNEDQKKLLLMKQRNICPICSLQLYYGEDMHVDHILPISIGGRDSMENIQITHKDCNQKKGSRIVLKDHSEEISSYLNKNEDESLEFKSTLFWNIKANKRDHEIENEVLKTIAGFNNYDGGTLLIGVDDKKENLGLDFDLKEGGLQNNDKFELHLRNIINDRLLADKWYLSKSIKISFKEYLNKTICIIVVNKGTKPIYTKDNQFYIRNGNSTISLGINEVAEYVKNNFIS